MSGSILIGTHYHPGSAEAVSRQERARHSLLGLADVIRVNLQFPEAPARFEGFECLPELHLDSVKVTGRPGVRKPVGRQAFDVLADAAQARGARYFGWVNSDILVLPRALELVRALDRQACLFCRTDVDAVTDVRQGVLWVGIDLFVYRVDWWQQNRWRFRNYVNSEGLWDPIYTATTLCHSNGLLFNNRDTILHPNHGRVWSASPFSDWNIYLAHRDFLYLQTWNRYAQHLLQHPPEGVSDANMERTQREFFTWPPPFGSRLWQYGRSLKAFGRYYLNKAGWIPSVGYPA